MRLCRVAMRLPTTIGAGYLLHGLLPCAYEVGIMDHAFNRKDLWSISSQNQEWGRHTSDTCSLQATPYPLSIKHILNYPKDFKPMKPKDRFQLRAGPYKSPSIPIGTIIACESPNTDVIVVDYFRWIVVTIEQGQQKQKNSHALTRKQDTSFRAGSVSDDFSTAPFDFFCCYRIPKGCQPLAGGWAQRYHRKPNPKPLAPW